MSETLKGRAILPRALVLGLVLYQELLEGGILHITPLCSLLHTLLKDKRMSENCKSLFLPESLVFY